MTKANSYTTRNDTGGPKESRIVAQKCLSDNGFEIIKNTGFKNFEVIFITAHEEYAIKAFKISAQDYILKPIDQNELLVALTKTIRKIEAKYPEVPIDSSNPNRKKLVLKTSESVYVIDFQEIIRCESDRNYTTFHLVNGNKIMVSKTLKEYELLLSGNGFMRVAQSHIVNFAFVERYDRVDGGTVVMKDGSQIPLSAAKRELFFKILENL